MSQRLDASRVAALLVELADRLELSGESPFKVQAYRNAAETLRNLPAPLSELVAQRKLKSLKGIGEALAEKIATLHREGTHRTLEALRQEVPDGLLELLQLPGLGPKKVLRLRDDLGVDSVEALATAAREGRVAEIKGFGPKQEQKLLEAIGFHRASAGKLRLPEADLRLAEAQQALAARQPSGRCTPAGPARRRCEVVEELCLLVEGSATEQPRSEGLPPVRVLHAPAGEWGLRLLYATGSPAHLRALEAHAASQGLELGPDGLSRNGRRLQTATEEALYQALGLAPIPPELREGREEIAWARAGRLPRLIEPGDLKGILHSHSSYSDGAHTLEEMAEAARGLGYEYFGICDHSQSAAYAGGLREDRIGRQHEEIDRLNRRYEGEGLAFRILKGIESDIREDGSLDYPETILARFDLIVASLHSHFELGAQAQTERVLKAVANPFTTILGHPTARLLLRRPGLPLDLARIIAACAEHGVCLEINAHPVRLDLDWRWHQQALQAGATLSINPDAHNIAELELLRYGVDAARKGGVEARNVLNALGLQALQMRLRERKERALR